MGVEPTTYTMRTYRSSQLSYCPLLKLLMHLIYTGDSDISSIYLQKFLFIAENHRFSSGKTALEFTKFCCRHDPGCGKVGTEFLRIGDLFISG